MNTDQLRDALAHHADLAPSETTLLEGALTRSRSLRRRRRIAVTGVAGVAAVALVVAGPSALRATLDQPSGAGPEALPGAPTPTPTAEPPPVSSAELVEPPTYEIPDFPFTLGWEPPGFPPAGYWYGSGALDGIPPYLRIMTEPRDGEGWYTVEAQARDTAPSAEKLISVTGGDTTQDAVTVQGREAVLRTATGVANEDEDEPMPARPVAVVTWQHEEDLWMSVSAEAAADAVRIADGLQATRHPIPHPVTFALLPEGLEPGTVGPYQMEFVPSGAQVPPDVDAMLRVELRSGGPGDPLGCEGRRQLDYQLDYIWSEPCSLPREPVQVGGRAGELRGDHVLHVFLEDGVTLRVVTLGDLTLSPEDLVRLAESIEVTPDARPFDQ